MCSVDDPKQVEAEMKQYKLSPGQDRMNFQCWLRVQDSGISTTAQAENNAHLLQMRLGKLGQLDMSSRHGSTTSVAAVGDTLGTLKKSLAHALGRPGSPSGQSNRGGASPSFRHMSRTHSRHGSSLMSQVGGPSNKLGHHSTIIGGGIKSRQNSTQYGPNSARALSIATGSRRASSSRASRLGGPGGRQPMAVIQKKKVVRAGVLTPKDPFFWFLQHNFAMYTFPNPPRHLLQQVRNGQNLAIHYHDFLSRNNSPTRDGDDMTSLNGKASAVLEKEALRRSRAASRLPGSRHSRAPSRSGSTAPSRSASRDFEMEREEFEEEASDAGNLSLSELDLEAGGAHLQLRSQQPQNPPPSICLCQPTELSSHVRERWELELKFVDDKKLILGDQGWWPGAAGYRFTHEVKTDDASLYVRLGTVPQAQLLYMYTKRVQGRVGKGDKEGKAVHADEDKTDSDASEEEVEEKQAPSPIPGLPQLSKLQSSKKKSRHKKIAEYFLTKPNKGPSRPPTSDMMLPPLLDGLGMPGVVLGVCS